MSGYVACLVNQEDALEHYFCCCCTLLLRKPVQVLAGEFAGDLYCQDCIPNRDLDYVTDKAVQREIFRLRVYCSIAGCGWQGSLKDYLQHSENCQSVKNDTEKENQLLREENAKLHYEIVCLKQQPVKAATRTGDPFDSYLPFVSFSEKQESLGPQLCIPLAEIKEIKTHSIQRPVMADVLRHPSTAHQEMPQEDSDFNRHIAQAQTSTLSLLDRGKQNEHDSSRFDGDLQQHRNGMSSYTRLSAFERIDFPPQQQKRKIYDVSANDFTVFTERPPNGSGMQCRWHIPNVDEKLAYARENPEKPLISPSWPTGAGGCCARAFVYLNGDGRGFGTHVSPFISLVQGPDDRFIPWPMSGDLVFVLLDQEHNARPILKRVRSERTLQRPPPSSLDIRNEMNTAYGCPCFTPIATLSDEKYVKDNTMTWEFSFQASLRDREE